MSKMYLDKIVKVEQLILEYHKNRCNNPALYMYKIRVALEIPDSLLELNGYTIGVKPNE